MIDFSTSLNPLGPPPAAIEAYRQAATRIGLYPRPYPRALEAHIGEWLGIDPECVLAGNGSTQLIYLVARELRLRLPAVVIPTFSEIGNALIAAGSNPTALETGAANQFRPQQEDLEHLLDSGADGIFVGRPNSPTGQLVNFQETCEIARLCDRCKAWCVIDEAFIEFADDPRSAIDLIRSFPRVLVLRSLTKIFALAGLRIGYLAGCPEVVKKLRDAIEPWSVNVAAEAAATACLEGSSDFVTRTRRLVSLERQKLEDKLARSAEVQLFRSAANFMMFRVKENEAGEFGRFMAHRGMVLRDLSALPGCGRGFYRIAMRLPEENARFLSAMTEYAEASR